MNRKRGITAAVVALMTVVAGMVGLTRQAGPGFYETARTRDIAYQAVPKTWDRWGTASTLEAKIDGIRVRLREHAGDGFRLRPVNRDEWGTKRDLPSTLKVLRHQLIDDPVMTVWLVKSDKDGYQAKARKIDRNPAVAMNTVGTNPIDIVAGTLRKLYPNVTLGGIYVCRTTIYGGISQHAFANAIDVFGSYDAMNKAAFGILSLVRKGYMPVSQILWRYKNLLSGNYVYDHTNHIHFSGSPLLSGSCRRAD